MKLLLVAVLLLTGCASVSEQHVSPVSEQHISPEALENALDAQEKWLRGLERGQLIQETTVSIVPGTQYSLEIFQHGTLYQYISGMYPDTATPYGLYFENGRLKGLLLGEDVEDFYYWEDSNRIYINDWLQSGMAQTTDWVETRNLLGSEFDARVTPRRRKMEVAEEQPREGWVAGGSTGDTAGTSGGDAIEAITTVFFLSPFILVAAPAVLLSMGGDEAPSEKEVDEAEEAAERIASQRAQLNVGKLRPGTTTLEDMLGLMGPPDYKRRWAGGMIWAYAPPKIYIGIADGIVVWKELSGGEL